MAKKRKKSTGRHASLPPGRQGKKSSPQRLVGILVFSILIIVAGVVFILPKYSNTPTTSNQFAFVQPTQTLLITPTLTPIPTVTPLPSPTPLSGYCLYVPVLMYHHVQPYAKAQEKGQINLSVDNGVFDQQMAYLVSQGYTTITAGQLVDALMGKSGLAAKSIVLTFDDGYKDNFDYVHPIIQKYGLTANLALSTGLVGGEDYVSWDNVKGMASSGRWQIINHTWSHYSLGRGDFQKSTYEVQTAKQQIQDNTGQITDLFVYPYGLIGGSGVLKDLGVRGAFSTIPGSLQCDSIVMQLRRTRIGSSPLSSYGF